MKSPFALEYESDDDELSNHIIMNAFFSDRIEEQDAKLICKTYAGSIRLQAKLGPKAKEQLVCDVLHGMRDHILKRTLYKKRKRDSSSLQGNKPHVIQARLSATLESLKQKPERFVRKFNKVFGEDEQGNTTVAQVRERSGRINGYIRYFHEVFENRLQKMRRPSEVACDDLAKSIGDDGGMSRDGMEVMNGNDGSENDSPAGASSQGSDRSEMLGAGGLAQLPS